MLPVNHFSLLILINFQIVEISAISLPFLYCRERINKQPDQPGVLLYCSTRAFCKKLVSAKNSEITSMSPVSSRKAAVSDWEASTSSFTSRKKSTHQKMNQISSDEISMPGAEVASRAILAASSGSLSISKTLSRFLLWFHHNWFAVILKHWAAAVDLFESIQQHQYLFKGQMD